MSSEKKRVKKATVDLRVQSTKSVVNMNQPWSDVLMEDSCSGVMLCRGREFLPSGRDRIHRRRQWRLQPQAETQFRSHQV